MPELPEVETVVRGLRDRIVGETIVDMEVPWEKAFAPLEAYDRLVGQTIRDVTRRAKYIIMHLDQGFLSVHLRMTGRLTLLPETRHVSVIFHFRSGQSLTFKDMRKFGRIQYGSTLDELLPPLGPEPLSADFDAESFTTALRQRSRQVKPLLLDQSFVAGLGNIYVDEALFQAGIHPASRADRLPKTRARALHQAIQKILSASIQSQGTTVVNFVHGDDQSGSYQAALNVYGKEKAPCVQCGGLVRKIRLGQRGTHFCPRCQRRY